MKHQNSLYIKNRRGLMLVLSSPSGAGKTSLSKAILELYKDIKLSVSMTTRSPRLTEIDGKDYFFVSQELFQDYKNKELFLETATVFGNQYGTPKSNVEKELASGHDVLFDIDWQGAQQLSQTGADNLVKVFVLPPSFFILEKRLKKRAEDHGSVIKNRMKEAISEMSHWAEYDYILMNDCFEDTLNKLYSIIEVERLRRHRQGWIQDFVHKMTDQNI